MQLKLKGDKMEELKYNEKGFNKKLLVIPILVILSIIAVLGFKYAPSVPLDNKVTTITTTITEQYTLTGSIVFDKDITTSDTVNLKAGRYDLIFSSDSDVTVLYGKQNFVICNNVPSKTGSCKFDVNSGSDGDYMLKVSGDSQKSHVTISQIMAF